jgi:hypothetical protein
MKKIIKFFVVVALMSSFSSCDEIDELTEVDFNTTINESFFVTVPDGTLEGQIYDVNIVNSDTEDYLNTFQDVDITSFTYRLVGFNGDNEGTIVGSFEYIDSVGAAGQILINHDMVVSQVVNAGTVFEVTDVGLLNAIANQLKSGQDVRFALEGEANCDAEMTFTLELSIGLAITADVL